MNGTVDYDPRSDFSTLPPGPLAGRGTARLEILGYRILIDARAYSGDAVVLMPFALLVDSNAPAPSGVSLLPDAQLSLEVRTTNPKTAIFMLASGGRIVLDDAYPFVDLEWEDWLQLIRLTRNEIRERAACCAETVA